MMLYSLTGLWIFSGSDPTIIFLSHQYPTFQDTVVPDPGPNPTFIGTVTNQTIFLDSLKKLKL